MRNLTIFTLNLQFLVQLTFYMHTNITTIGSPASDQLIVCQKQSTLHFLATRVTILSPRWSIRCFLGSSLSIASILDIPQLPLVS